MAFTFRRVLRVVWWILCCTTLLALPVIVWEFKRQGYSIHYKAWFIAGLFVILAIPMSVYQVALHMEYYTRPRLQRHVVRILWMVPIYGLDAWFSLRFIEAHMFLTPIRECYEAYVIYNFFSYLMNFLADETGDIEDYLAKKEQVEHPCVLRCCVKPWEMGHQYLWECKKGILNFVILRPVCTALGLIAEAFGRFGHGELNPTKAYLYLTLVTNISQAWALYCLAMLYAATRTELKPIRPLSKFICIKFVVFLTFWQGILLTILVHTGTLKPTKYTTYDATDIAFGLQDFLICIEMFFAAIGHAYAFPPRDYMDPSVSSRGFFFNVYHMFDLSDFVGDVQDVVGGQITSSSSAVKSRSKNKPKAPSLKPPQTLASLISDIKER